MIKIITFHNLLVLSLLFMKLIYKFYVMSSKFILNKVHMFLFFYVFFSNPFVSLLCSKLNDNIINLDKLMIILSILSMFSLCSGENKIKAYLRGSMIEYVQKDVSDALENDNAVFVLLRYVVTYRGKYEQCPCLISYSNATALIINPLHAQVQRLKEDIISNFH